jgi:hypothetical protein
MLMIMSLRSLEFTLRSSLRSAGILSVGPAIEAALDATQPRVADAQEGRMGRGRAGQATWLRPRNPTGPLGRATMRNVAAKFLVAQRRAGVNRTGLPLIVSRCEKGFGGCADSRQ